MPREYGRLRERQTVLECEPDERMPQIVEADALAMIVQPGLSAASCTARSTFRADCGDLPGPTVPEGKAYRSLLKL